MGIPGKNLNQYPPAKRKKILQAYKNKRSRVLQMAVDQIFAAADEDDLSNKTLAQKSKLCYATVLRLSNYTTIYPRWNTIERLAAAVGKKPIIE